jgi:hypothetical protein
MADDTTTPAEPVKPGYRTTEFWLSAVAVLLGLAVASGIIPAGSSWDQAVGLVVAALAAMGYTGARAGIKRLH